MKEGNHWRFGVQAANINPSKPGYIQGKSHPEAGLLMADRMPRPNEDTGWKVKPGKVVLPNQPYPLDFVMVPDAR